jgi:hypothetical protein
LGDFRCARCHIVLDRFAFRVNETARTGRHGHKGIEIVQQGLSGVVR